MFPPRKAPAGAKFSWNDSEGTHHSEVGADGVLEPASAGEEEFAVSMGWPVVKEKPAAPAKEEPAKPAKPGKSGEKD